MKLPKKQEKNLKNNDQKDLLIEEYESHFSYEAKKSNLNISFNRVAFIFFIFFTISIIFSTKAVYLGSLKKQITQNKEILEKIIYQCKKCKIKIIELPFVDSSSLENFQHQNQIIKNLESIKRIAEVFGIIVSISGLLLLGALLTFSPDDPNFIFPDNTEIKNFFGFQGSFTSDLFFQSMGLISYLISFTLIITGINILRSNHKK